MYTSYIMETIARQQMDENARNARRANGRTDARRTPRTFRVPRVTWHRQAVRTA
jgi:hypothetical protein